MAYAQQPYEPAPRPAAMTQPPEPRHITLRIVGSQVRNPSGDKLGRIEEVLLNRATHAIEYAVLAPNFPTNESRLVPVPWSILNYAWDQSRVGGPAGANQIFIANLEPTTLAKAPAIDRARTTGIDFALEAANSFFGSGIGGTGSSSGTTGGSGSGEATTSPSYREPFYYYPPAYSGVGFIDTNRIPIPTNGTSPGIPTSPGAPMPPGTNTGTPVPFQPGAAPPFTPFPGGTNSQLPQANPGANNDLKANNSPVGQLRGTRSPEALLLQRPVQQRSFTPAPTLQRPMAQPTPAAPMLQRPVPQRPFTPAAPPAPNR